jgi:hypothetical protein
MLPGPDAEVFKRIFGDTDNNQDDDESDKMNAEPDGDPAKIVPPATFYPTNDI